MRIKKMCDGLLHLSPSSKSGVCVCVCDLMVYLNSIFSISRSFLSFFLSLIVERTIFEMDECETLTHLPIHFRFAEER